MGQTSRIIEDSSTEGKVDYAGTSQEVSEGKHISKWPRHHSCDILAKNVVGFYLCSKILLENKLKIFGLMSSAEEISRKPFIVCAMWLLVIYKEKKRKLDTYTHTNVV